METVRCITPNLLSRKQPVSRDRRCGLHRVQPVRGDPRHGPPGPLPGRPVHRQAGEFVSRILSNPCPVKTLRTGIFDGIFRPPCSAVPIQIFFSSKCSDESANCLFCFHLMDDIWLDSILYFPFFLMYNYIDIVKTRCRFAPLCENRKDRQ